VVLLKQKVNVAATLSALCKDDGLQVKLLLGGCIPPLLSLLKSKSIEARKAAAEAIYEVSSGRSLMIKSVSRFAQKV
jgi:vesicle coat complex subunit